MATVEGAATNAAGMVVHCLYATDYRGDWRAWLSIASAVTEPLEPHGEPALALDGRTAAGVPTTLEALISGDHTPTRGDLAQTSALLCAMPTMRASPVLTLWADLRGSVRLGADQQSGEVVVQAVGSRWACSGCPVAARVLQPALEEARVPIEVRADAVSQIRFVPDANTQQSSTTATRCAFESMPKTPAV